ncbi:glycosyltransferase family 2 protein [Parabacteroides sp.]
MDNRISIVIPIYNRGYCLSRCLDSVLKQTFADWECILVDDASTDNSWQICCEYVARDSRFQAVKQSENGGVSIARNRGLELARGEYIAFIDSDDWIEPNYLSVLYQFTGQKIMPFCGIAVHDKKGEIYSTAELQDEIYRLDNSEVDLLVKFFKSGLFCSPVGRLYIRMIIEENHLHFQPEINWGEDLIFNCSYLEYIECLKYVSSSFYHVMEQEISLTSSHVTPFLLENNMKLWHSVYTFWEKKGIHSKRFSRALRNYHFRLLFEPLTCFYSRVGYQVSYKDRLSFVKDVMKNVDVRVVIKWLIIFRIKTYYYLLFNYRLIFLTFLLWEASLLKKKYITNR